MIKLQDLTPEVYYKQSRDFQFIGRLYDLVLNSVKTNTDMISDIPSSDTAGTGMIDLLALTLGFKPRHNYNVKQLGAICSIFPIILKNKGNILALKLACDAILHAEGITDEPTVMIDKDNLYDIKIFISQHISDVTLLNDLLDYILPAGITCEIIKANAIKAPVGSTQIGIDTTIVKTIVKNQPSAEIINTSASGLSDADKDYNHVNGLLDGNGNRIPGFTINSTIYGDNRNQNNGGN